jgi:3-deoxy-manno-octulosonate cytidylyltransferase (CMP-KDO synthetase)
VDKTSRAKDNVKIVGVIPARFHSTHFEGKPLKEIAGKPLLQWVIQGALQSKRLSEVLVATDDDRISQLAQKCGVKTVMTDPDLPSGSDRVWAAIENKPCDYVLNIQGDEPLITGEVLDTLAGALADGIDMATLARPLKNEAELLNPSVAKIVVNHRSEALYFSRLPIPHSRGVNHHPPFFGLKHIGLYGYDVKFLKRFCKNGPVELEIAEGLEQLRALYMGASIKVVLTEYESWGVDTLEDVVRVEELIKNRGRRL